MNNETIYRDLISTSVLAEHLGDPAWVIVDCRFDLADPAWGQNQYAAGHIPGAIYAHLDRDLSGKITPQSGRHPLPNPAAFASLLSNWGIGPETQVVVYDQSGGAFAARLWWMLHYFGHERAAVLDGGYTKWTAEGNPVDLSVLRRARVDFIPHIRPDMLVSTQEVLSLLSDPSVALIDARAPIRYRGETEPIDPVAGHIPDALNRFQADNLSSDGTFLAATELSNQFHQLLGSAPPEKAVVYCGSGVTSCHHVLAMAVAGMPMPRLYAGSWSEWIRDPHRPTVPPREQASND